MIGRIWQGATRARDADAYVGYLAQTGFAEYRATPGNLVTLGLRRVVDDRAEFRLLTAWEDEAAIRRFAGDDMTRARFYPEDDRYLVQRAERSEHLDVVYLRGEARVL